jgi:hypothetical protein
MALLVSSEAVVCLSAIFRNAKNWKKMTSVKHSSQSGARLPASGKAWLLARML